MRRVGNGCRSRCMSANKGIVEERINGSEVTGNGSLLYPRRLISWWSRIEDMTWPDTRIRDKIQRRADACAKAGIDTVIHFGFHFRFDFLWYFGIVHGLLADIANALHERNIRFLDHYSCNLIARPRNIVEMIDYNTSQRHHIAIYPDRIAAETAEYAGYRLKDLREISVETGEPIYFPTYQCEMLCHNNLNYRAMHEAYIKRQLTEIPLDGFMMDDMCFYSSFRTCGCRFCREKFSKEYGRELPPITDKSFWGDTSGHPITWGNYANPAFCDWVRMRFQSTSEHLKMVREIIGPNRILMTCCSDSGDSYVNSYGLSYENFIDQCDWVMMENCGLSAKTVQWTDIESNAMLHKAIAESKPGGRAACVALSYFLFDDGAYLGWAISRFWGVQNWASTNLGIPIEPTDVKEDTELVGPINRWEIENNEPGPGDDVTDLQIAFLRASRDNGWVDEKGQSHWRHVQRWAKSCAEQSIGYRFVLTAEIEEADRLSARKTPLLLDGCSHLSNNQIEAIRAYLKKGGILWLAPPLGSYDERGKVRKKSFVEELRHYALLSESIVFVDSERPSDELSEMVRQKLIQPKIRWVGGSNEWAVRGRIHGNRLMIHLLNMKLAGTDHPTLLDRGGNMSGQKVMQSFVSKATNKMAELEIDFSGLPCKRWQKP